jgi:hypothetical protein
MTKADEERETVVEIAHELELSGYLREQSYSQTMSWL